MPTYTNITEDEMSAFLVGEGFRKLTLPGVSEVVFGKRVDSQEMLLTIRIYTGIFLGESREVGKDAIRTVLFWKSVDRIVKIASVGRVNRTKNWRDNLKDRIDEIVSKIPNRFCPDCNCPMVLREVKSNKSHFLGCCNYPECKRTFNI